MTRNTQSSGFTLIELLVVIAIVSLISSIALTSLNTAREKARDAKRISELRQIQTALEVHASFNDGVYPTTSGNSCDDLSPLSAALAPLVGEGYLDSVLDDPLNDGTYCYIYLFNTYNISFCGEQVPYALMFTSEATTYGLPTIPFFPRIYCLLP